MSRVIRFDRFGPADVLQCVDVPTPSPGKGEVLVQVEAIGVSWEDVLWRQNLAAEPAQLPAGIGSELAGTVAALGADIGDLALGQHVASFKAHTPNSYPAYGESMVMPREALTAYEPRADFGAAEAATHYTAMLSAYLALTHIARLKPGQRVLVTESGLCIGGAMVQVAHALGAEVIAATRFAGKEELLKALGASSVVLTEEQDLALTVARLTDTRGVEVIADGCGGHQMAVLGDIAAPCGKLILYGLDGGNEAAFPAWTAFRKHLQFAPFSLVDYTGQLELGIRCNKEAVKPALDWINRETAAGRLKTKVARRFPFADFVAAHEYLEAHPGLGRVVLTL
ncbi:NADPH:quinone reductase-like Zn-dependent oxidoreductase [Dongia mobilis]|uniref:NADPH:quinone reductase-like Zn-dependent oxidoreductase n=1 Tax=Dongia mobilis TaxID=578943 RepID=A0A4R6WNF9_9PROT|nr:zinc-dependent alcohol dehydrogenase family protein [Dongia mobilis]TDQ80490.1 NADPH:quinone reductase-like Zn-dependent oxidoreductase [Dongia mobilis]